MTAQGKAKDPVCGMEVDPSTAAGQSTHNGKTYYFCSEVCKQKFDQRPNLYAPQDESKS